MQIDFFLKQPEEIKKIECIDISTITYPVIYPRTWNYSDIIPNTYFLYKTGGTNRFCSKKGDIFPKLINVRNNNKIIKARTGGGNGASYCTWGIRSGNMITPGGTKGTKAINLKCHRITAEAFLLNNDPRHFVDVDHKNQDHFDFSLDNLRWVTKSQNVKNIVRGKTTDWIDERVRRGFSNGGFVG